MFMVTRRVAGGRAKQRLPRSLQGLSTPNIRRSWWDIRDLSSEEKKELLCGPWRKETPIRLVPSPGSRDSYAASELPTFATDEAVDHYLADEDKDEVLEASESTLALAERFFAEIANTVDEEIDAAQMPPNPQSDEERRREMRDVQREFFGDFYVEQGIVDASSRYAFVDTMLRPSRPLFLVNTVLPLTRLTVRDQLETHCAVTRNLSSESTDAAVTDIAGAPRLLPVFTPTPMNPCLYAIPLPPTQTFGAPLHARFSAESSRWIHSRHQGDEPTQVTGRGPSSAVALEGTQGSAHDQKLLSCGCGSADFIVDADEVGAMMLDALPCPQTVASQDQTTESPSPTPEDCRKLEATAGSSAEAASAMFSLAPRPPAQPPSLAHMYWLQRQVASDAILNVDDVSVAVSLLSVWLAASLTPSGGAPHPYEMILCQANNRDSTACAYHTEIAQYIFQVSQEEASDPVAAERLTRVVIAVEDLTFSGGSGALLCSSKRDCSGRRRQRHTAHQAALPWDESTVPVMDRYPNMVYLPPTSLHARGRLGAPHRGKVEGSTSALSVVRFPIRVVLCMPATSRDGVRPRGWLAGTEDEATDEDAGLTPFAQEDPSRPHRSAQNIFSGAPPNNFVERCRMASANFSELQEQLYSAIHAVTAEGFGWVIYATQSANVIENEAVVCAVLKRICEERDGKQTHRSLRSSAVGSETEMDRPVAVLGDFHLSLSVECVPLDSPTMEACIASPEATSVLRLLCSEGRRGLSTWTAIENGSPEQEAAQVSEELRASVARAAWRTDPMRTGSDGGFVVCLRVTRREGTQQHQHGRSREAVAGVPPQRDCWWTHPASRVVSAVTPATLRFLTDVERSDRAGRRTASTESWKVLHAGVPVGYVSTRPGLLASGCDGLTTASGLPAGCCFSSATCHVDALRALRDSLPRLSVSVNALCELLLLQHIESHKLRRQLRYCQQHAMLQQERQGDAEGSAADVDAETRAFLAAVETLTEEYLFPTPTAAKLPKRFYVWVGVDASSLLPSGQVSSHLGAAEVAGVPPAAGCVALESPVMAEVEAAGVIAEVECSRYPSFRDSSSSLEFSLRLDVPPDMPERFKHLAALEEWRVALRDALLYVRRRTTKESRFCRLWAHRSMDDTPAPTPRFLTGHGSGAVSEAQSDTPVELADDEYESLQETRRLPTPEKASLGSSWDHPTTRDLVAEEKKCDWLRDTNYSEWRRRQTRR